MRSAPQPLRVARVLGWGLAFALVIDVWADGPPGAGVLIAAAVAAGGLVLATRPAAAAIAFLAAGTVSVSFVIVRASPVLAAIDVASGMSLFALAAAFARGGDPLRTGLRAYAARGLGWVASVRPALAVLASPVTRLRPAGTRLLPAVPRALLFTLPVGLVFALLLGSADAVFADLLRSPLERVPFSELPRHLVIVGIAGAAFALIAVRASTPLRLERAARPIEGGVLRPPDWISLLVTVDVLFTLFVAVQLFTFFGGRRHVLAEAGLSFAEYARSGFWQMLAAATLTGALIAGAWIGGRPQAGRRRVWFVVLSTLLVALAMVLLASAFHRLVLYETAFGYTWPRLIPHVAILLTGALLTCGVIAIVSGRTAWLPSAALGLGFVALIGSNLLDPEAFIAERNIARVERGHRLDTSELASLSADAVPATVATLPTLDPTTRTMVEQNLSCLREELRDGVERFGWASFNVARDIALERLNALALPSCESYPARSGRLRTVFSHAASRRQRSTAPWSPERRTSGTVIPRNSAGRV
jgi:hypothetical protein